ncbi:hypothetical protein LWI28_014128 [Acer negundo]|uniref:Uncharacterized protein n=1 Tax=Acer negundo TaxID=4023 RepID=A0AAD5I6W6_ACENE|nr:hypothetical protein LWI28_014128 [Acer negundo]
MNSLLPMMMPRISWNKAFRALIIYDKPLTSFYRGYLVKDLFNGKVGGSGGRETNKRFFRPSALTTMVLILRFYLNLTCCRNETFGFVDFIGRKLQAKADDGSNVSVDPPKVEEKLGVLLYGLLTNSDVAKRLGTTLFKMLSFLC